MDEPDIAVDWHATAVEHLGHCPCDAVRVHGPNSVDWQLDLELEEGAMPCVLLLRPSQPSLFAALDGMMDRFPGMNRSIQRGGYAPDGVGLWVVI